LVKETQVFRKLLEPALKSQNYCVSHVIMTVLESWHPQFAIILLTKIYSPNIPESGKQIIWNMRKVWFDWSKLLRFILWFKIHISVW